MITIKNKSSIEKMEVAGKLLSQIMYQVAEIIVPDVSTLDIDLWIENKLKENGLISKAKGYRGYPCSTCISVNDEVVHGIPKKNKILKSGDLVKVDVCASWKGYCADMARCFFVNQKCSGQEEKFVSVAKSALNAGIEKAYPGNRLSDISSAIQLEVENNGYGIVRDFAGHGIGKNMHEDPEILNYGEPGKGPILRSGMTFAIEPMITLGDYNVYIADDGWTVKTRDKSLAAHVEDTILITDNGPRILTRLNDSRK